MKKTNLSVVLVVALALSFGRAGDATAATVSWIGSSGNWSNDTVWSGGAKPTLGDSALITNGAVVTVDRNGELARYVGVGSEANRTGTLQITSGSLIISNSVQSYDGLQVGDNGRGYLTMSAGLLVMTNSGATFTLGRSASGYGTATISGGMVSNLTTIVVGGAGRGQLDLNGSGSVIRLRDGNSAIGVTGTGMVNQTDGQFIGSGVLSILIMGVTSGGNGTYSLGGGSVTNVKFFVGGGINSSEVGHGRLEISGSGTIYCNGDGGNRIGKNTGCTGTVVQTGGKIQGILNDEVWNMGAASNAVGSWTISGGMITNVAIKNGSDVNGISLFRVIGTNAGISLVAYTNTAKSTLRFSLTSAGIQPIEVRGPSQYAGFGGGSLTLDFNGGMALLQTNQFNLMKLVSGNFGGAFDVTNTSVFSVVSSKPASDSFLTATLNEAQKVFSTTASYSVARSFSAANKGWFVISTNGLPSPTFNLGLKVETTGAAKTVEELVAYMASGGFTATNITSPTYPYNVMVTLPTPSAVGVATFAWDFSALDANLKVSAAKGGPQPLGFVLMIR